MSNTARWQFGPLEGNEWRWCRLDPPKNGGENFRADFCTLNFLGGGQSCYGATQLIVALSPGHSDITKFRPRSAFAKGNHLVCVEKYSNCCSADWHRWGFKSTYRHFWTHFAESFRMSKSSWMMDPTHSREMPICSAIQLAEIRRSSKISLWIWSIIFGVVTVLGRPRQGASETGKSPCLNWATQFFDGSTRQCMLSHCLCQNGVNFLGRLALPKKKLDDSTRPDAVEIARVAWHSSFLPL